ncbi:PH domain-containing protein [Chryseobacterium sp. 09-1422]|jgi:membrane protein YdbS with pleckstrin-like domain|uniref:PH domain-containing protein n=1 Tax=Chryseobacterium kimseyorum TaxID=2984028 RepID=A0ABT3HUB2_9FLAO|nr:PH domain-containing protein [Chryseobacterium kimseyorum]MCW3167386.1 PH domain-containing protein [Chryseobacterium kimseyorum]
MENNFQNFQVFDLKIPDFGDLKLVSISPKYLQIILLNIVLFSVFLIGVMGVAFYFFYFNLSSLEIWAIVVGIFLLIVFLFLNAVIGFKFRKYAIREKDLVYQHGWFKRTLMIVPFKRIQHIKVEQGWFSKILNLKSVAVYTAGVSGGDITINGLPEDIAEGINNLIRESISKEKTDNGGEA